MAAFKLPTSTCKKDRPNYDESLVGKKAWKEQMLHPNKLDKYLPAQKKMEDWASGGASILNIAMLAKTSWQLQIMVWHQELSD